MNFECKAIGVENPVWYLGYPVKEESKYFLFNGHKKIEVREETICRNTGKVDSNGEMLYQNDVIMGSGNTYMAIRFGKYEAYCPNDKCYMENVGFYVEAEGYPIMPLGPTEGYATKVDNLVDTPDFFEEDDEVMKEHKEGCIYEGRNVLYALQEVCGKKFIIAASEFSLFDTYLEYAENGDRDLSINYNEADNEPYQIVYGSVIVNPLYSLKKFEEIVEMANNMKGYVLLELIDDEKIRVSGYDDIYILEHGKAEGNYPFAALMKSKNTFENPNCSNTMFPAVEHKCVWDSIVNRRFLMACRYAEQPDGLTKENWRSFISEDKMIEINKVADLYTGED